MGYHWNNIESEYKKKCIIGIFMGVSFWGIKRDITGIILMLISRIKIIRIKLGFNRGLMGDEWYPQGSRP